MSGGKILRINPNGSRAEGSALLAVGHQSRRTVAVYDHHVFPRFPFTCQGEIGACDYQLFTVYTLADVDNGRSQVKFWSGKNFLRRFAGDAFQGFRNGSEVWGVLRHVYIEMDSCLVHNITSLVKLMGSFGLEGILPDCYYSISLD